jgi:hypothetical protein
VFLAVGKADVDTIISPGITFWKNAIKKHTHFSMEPKNQEFQGSVGYNKTITAQISRSADLVAKCWVKILSFFFIAIKTCF